jgi:hypothetical protein
LPCTGSGVVHGTLCISTHQDYSGPLDEIAIYEHYNPASDTSGTSMSHASPLAAIPSPSTHPWGPGRHLAVLRLVLQPQVASRKLVSQLSVVDALYATCSSFPVEVESEALSSAMEASLR